MSATTAESNSKPISLRLCWLTGIVLLPTAAMFICLILTFLGYSCSFALGLLSGALCVASVTDLHHRKIPNWLTYSTLFWGLTLNAIVSALYQFDLPLMQGSGALPNFPNGSFGSMGLLDSLAGAGCCFAAMLVGYLASGTGAGDVKLLAAVGALAGVSNGMSTLLWGYIAAGVMIVLWQILFGNPILLIGSLCRNLGSSLAPGWINPPVAEQNAILQRPFPLAAAFAVGAAITYFGKPFGMEGFFQ